jgi:Ca-activated chloride channel family protein
MFRNDSPFGSAQGLKWLNTSITLICVAVLMCLCNGVALGQVKDIQSGNKLYEEMKYKEAANDYAKALAKDPNNTSGIFNLGNSLYQQKQYDSSRKVMERALKTPASTGNKAAANYNIGNSYMSQQKYEDAINAYKQTLRSNPQDADAKYNLSYAEEMLKKQQNKDKQNKDKDKKDNKDKKDQKQDKDKKNDKGKDKDKQKQPDNKDQKQDQDKQEPQSQPSKMSQQQAESALNALQQDEKKLQDKLKKEKGVPMKLQKDW